MMDYALSGKRLRHLDDTDGLPPGLRQCVHEFGYPIVYTLMKFGIKDPRHIREIVMQVWLGPREGGQTPGAAGALDYILAQGPMNSAALHVLLSTSNMAIVPMIPTKAMVEASMATVRIYEPRLSKDDKHKRRLIAAIAAAPDFKRQG